VKVGESRISEAWLAYVPKAIRLALQIDAGDELEWYIENEEVIVKKKKKEEPETA